jgi:hypothetical protein
VGLMFFCFASTSRPSCRITAAGNAAAGMQDQPKFAIVHEVIGRTGSRGQVCCIMDALCGKVAFPVDDGLCSRHPSLALCFYKRGN